MLLPTGLYAGPPFCRALAVSFSFCHPELVEGSSVLHICVLQVSGCALRVSGCAVFWQFESQPFLFGGCFIEVIRLNLNEYTQWGYVDTLVCSNFQPRLNSMVNKRTIINFSLVFFTITLIAYAWIFNDLIAAIVASSTYLLKLLLNVIDLIIKSKEYKRGINIKTTKNKLEEITDVTEGILVIGSLFAMAPDNNLYKIPGRVIWFGQIVNFILVGPIVEIFAGIPMKMTYGGWKLRYRK